MTFLIREFLLLVRTVKKSFDDAATDLASSIAFWAFFSLFPLILAVIAVAGHILQSAEAQERVYELVAQAFPGSAEMLRGNIAGIVEARGTMGLAAVLGLVWSTSAGFGAITRAINRAVGSGHKRSILWAKLRYLRMALTVLALLVVYTALTSVVEIAKLDDEALVPWIDFEMVSSVTTRLASFFVVFLIFALLYKEAPTVKTRWRDVWRGAVFATVLTELGKMAFVAYLDYLADLKSVFGSLSSIMVLLLWLYVSAIALIVGAEYNVARAERRA